MKLPYGYVLIGSESVISLAKEINAGKNTVKKWIRIFKAYGDSHALNNPILFFLHTLQAGNNCT